MVKVNVKNQTFEKYRTTEGVSFSSEYASLAGAPLQKAGRVSTLPSLLASLAIVASRGLVSCAPLLPP
jgi:hypothetical protein